MKTANNYYKEYWRIAWPAALEGLLIILLQSTDFIMVSSLGTRAVAAVGIFSQPKMMILCLCRSLSVAVTALVARCYGQKEYAKLERVLKQSLTIAVIISLVVFVVTEIYMKQILLLAGADAEYLDLGIAYGLMANLSLIFQGPTLILNAALTGVGKTREMLISNIAGNICNVILNAVFIFVLGWGVAGVGFATCAGSALSLLMSFKYVNREDAPTKMHGLADFMPASDVLKSIRVLVVGIFLEQLFERIGMFLYSYMTARLGTADFAAHNITMTFCDIFYTFAGGFSKASLTLAAMYFFSKGKDEIKKLYKVFFNIPLASALGFCVLYLVITPLIIPVYSKDLEVVSGCMKLIIPLAYVCFPEAVQMSISGVLRGIGLTNYVAKYSLADIAIFRPILTWFLCFYLGWGLTGAWISLCIDQTIRAICAVCGRRLANR